jgi:WD40 repeat protein
MPSYRYPGPRPFEENDIDLFFGRDKDKKKLLSLVTVEPLVVIFSKSGLGKSSLVNAAIIPELRKKNYEIIVSRFNSYVGKERTENLDNENPSPSKKILNDIDSRLNEQKTFLDDLAPDGRQISLWHRLKNLQISNGATKPYLIFFDQFEELFTYPADKIKEFKENLAEVLSPSIPQEYLDQLNEAEGDSPFERLSDQELGLLYDPIPVKLLFTIRSDKFSLLTNLKDAIPGIVTKTYELKPFDTIEATNAIRNPAKLENKPGESTFIAHPFLYDDDAIKKMLNYLTDEGTEDIESFQLQVLCRYVEDIVIDNKAKSKEIKTITADQLGDIKNVFEQYYNKLIGSLDETQVKHVKRLFEEGLIFEKEKIRLQLYQGQITSVYDVDADLLNKLVATHLIRCEPDSSGREKYELSHDSLIEPILKAKEKRLVEENAKQIVLKREKERAERIWKIKKRIASVAGIICLIAVFGVVVYYLIERKDQVKILTAQFERDERDWFKHLDSWQQNAVLDKKFLLLKHDDSVQYNRIKYSYKCAAYANQNFRTDAILALQFAKEGYLKDFNVVVKKTFDSLINKVALPLAPKIRFYGKINNTKITEDEKSIISTTSRGIFWFNAKTAVAEDSLTGIEYGSDYSAFSRDGKYVVYETFFRKTTYLLNLLTRKYLKIETRHGTSQDAIALDIANNDSFFVHASSRNAISKFSITGKLIAKYDLPMTQYSFINELSISPGENYLAAGTNDGDVFLVDLHNPPDKKNPLVLTDTDDFGAINSISFSHDGRFILTGSSDKKVQIWDIKNKRIIQTIEDQEAVSKCAFSMNDSRVILGSKTSGTISHLHKQTESGSGQDGKFIKDSVQFLGLNSPISSVNFYSNVSKIIASSYNEISLWNLNSDPLPVRINAVLQSAVIPTLSLNEKINWNLISLEDLSNSTATKNEVLEGIQTLNDSIKYHSYKTSEASITGFINLIFKLYDHLGDCKEGELSKLDSFNLFNYMSTAYSQKISMSNNAITVQPTKDDFAKLVRFRQASFKLDTAQHECFQNLNRAYLIPVDYYTKNKQYDSSLYWNDKILPDNPWLKDMVEIQPDLTIVYAYDVLLNLYANNISNAGDVLQKWQNQDDIYYVLSKQLVEIFANPNYNFNKPKLSEALKHFDLTNTSNKQKLKNMEAIIFSFLQEKSEKQTKDNLKKLDDYLYNMLWNRDSLDKEG